MKHAYCLTNGFRSWMVVGRRREGGGERRRRWWCGWCAGALRGGARQRSPPRCLSSMRKLACALRWGSSSTHKVVRPATKVWRFFAVLRGPAAGFRAPTENCPLAIIVYTYRG